MQQGLSDELYNLVDQYATNDAFTPREKLAIEFAEKFAFDHTAIGDDMFARLKVHFTDTEILELTVTVGFCVGIGRAFHVLDIARDFDVLWSREANGVRRVTVKRDPATADGHGQP
jgi:alkylhydroperoxidase family enzyme